MKYEVYLAEYETEVDAKVVDAGIISDSARFRVEEFEKERVEFACAGGTEVIVAMARPLNGGIWKKIIVRGEMHPYYYATNK